MKLILNTEFDLYQKDGTAFCDSLQVAETFGKEHKNVLRDIEKITEPTSGLSEKFRRLNFELSSYKNTQNKKQPKYLLTKDGFTILTFGYSGKKAMVFKEAFINRFNQMEQFIKSFLATRLEFPDFTNAIVDAHEEPKHYHFSNEINMIYKIALGMNATKFREINGLEKGCVIKPYLNLEQIEAVELLQRTDIGLLDAKLSYEERKSLLTSKLAREQLKLAS